MALFLNPNTQNRMSFQDVPEYEYDYPRELDLRPGSEKHQMLRDEVLRRAGESSRSISARYGEWRETDRVLRAYVPEPFYEDIQKAKNSGQQDVDRYGYVDKGKKKPRIVFPATYATLETFLTYMTSAFLQPPFFRYKGFGPEDTFGGKLMELVIQQQMQHFYAGLALHTQWRDAFAYGIGPIAATWCRQEGFTTERRETGILDDIMSVFRVNGSKPRKSKRKVLYEGNKLINIDPYNFLPDPASAGHDIQGSEFMGWVENTNTMRLLKNEEYDSDLFNCQYLKHFDPRSQFSRRNGGDRDASAPTQREKTSSNNPADVIWMYIDLIPSDFGLGRKNYPEKWMFGLAGDEVIISAKPLGLHHNMIPTVCAAPEYDGYTAAPVSKLHLISDIQLLVDFLYASHIENLRTAVNNQFVVDPYLVNMNDVTDPEPGKVIRLRQAAWGKLKMDQAISQLPVTDVTRNNVNEAEYLMGIMYNAGGATDAMQGVMENRGPRISSSQFSGSRMAGFSRMARTAQIISMQSHQPLAKMLAAHTQQFMSRNTYVEITAGVAESLAREYGGSLGPVRNNRMLVTAMDLNVEIDLDYQDASVPGSEDVSSWIQLFQIASSNPMVMMSLEMPKIFTHIAKQLGAKNIDQFLKQSGPPQVQPDQQVLQQAQAGNLVPVGGDGALA